jgi:nitrogen regulatory protein PII
MNMIIAYFRPIMEDDVVERLRALEVPGASLTEIDGFGLEADPGGETSYGPQVSPYADVVRLEVICPAARTDELAEAIARTARRPPASFFRQCSSREEPPVGGWERGPSGMAAPLHFSTNAPSTSRNFFGPGRAFLRSGRRTRRRPQISQARRTKIRGSGSFRTRCKYEVKYRGPRPPVFCMWFTGPLGMCGVRWRLGS